ICEEKQIPVFQTFGMTETASQIVTLSPEYMLDKQGSAGKALFPSEVKISHNHKELSPREHGEILVKGPTVTKGYWKREGAT
ncbi:AMP-binding protein, partial [Micrococcus sp. SIMBA_131]